MHIKTGRQAVLTPSSDDHAADGLKYHLYHSFEAVDDLKEAWNDLAVRAGDILSSFDYCQLWWKHFNRWRHLEIHTLHDQQRLVAVLPLFRETIHPGGIRLRTIRGLGCDYTITTVGLAIEPAYAERFMQLVLDSLDRGGRWDMLELAPLRSYARVIEPMAQACLQHSRIQTVILGINDGWDIAWNLPKSYEDFLKSLPGRTRTEMNRRQRQLNERHHVEFAVAGEPEQVQPGIDALIRLHQKRWTDKGWPGQFGWGKPVEDFHRQLAERLAPRGQLMLAMLKIDGQIVSVTYGYHFGRRTHALMGGQSYEEQWQRYGLGKIMYAHLIRYIISHGSDVLEDGRGLFEHKLSMGGQFQGARSLVLVSCGRFSRLRFYLALRGAYVFNVLYSRIWVDMIAPRLGVRPKGRHFHLRNWVLAQLHRRVQFPLFGGPKLLRTQCLEPAPS